MLCCVLKISGLLGGLRFTSFQMVHTLLMCLLVSVIVHANPLNSSSSTLTPYLLPTTPTGGVGFSPPPVGGGGIKSNFYAFEFSGYYTWGSVISLLCSDGYCRTQLPREFFEMSVPLNIYENSFESAFKALALQAKADGYILKKTGKNKPFLVTASSDSIRTSAFISCFDTLVHLVPSNELSKHVLSDSLRCVARTQNNALRADSLRLLRDSIFIPSAKYRISFYVVSSSFVSSLGVDWTSIFAKGDLFNIPELITDWTFKAVALNDTTSEFRSIEIDIDTSAYLHWGSQFKESSSVVVYDNGVSNTSYEWRNYGLTLRLSRSIKYGIKGDYTLLQKDENNSILSGNFGGGGLDSVQSFGVFDSYQYKINSVPVLGFIPILGSLFRSKINQKIKSFFAITIYRVDNKKNQNFNNLDSLRVLQIDSFTGVTGDSIVTGVTGDSIVTGVTGDSLQEIKK